ncbi:DUF2066 domain-containing protein [Aestuariivirga sp.]|uniref:DUF2066 domain-containing protein n=1 Tax=Aestuariivirga sp. TaxID=2650926 RepID=UPI003BAC0667
MHLSRRSLLALGGALALCPRGAVAAPLAALYQARTIVTGRRPETTVPGLARCLAQVLVRVSGDQRVAQHPALAGLSTSPEAGVKGYSYRDLYASRPLKDEQGTRDRPYEMTVEYVPAEIDAMLAKLGSRPWLAERPRLVVFLAVHHIGSTFILSSLADQGDLMRESFKDAAWNSAMEVVIPSAETIAKAGLTVETLPGAPLSSLLERVDRKVGQIPLAGTLDWSKELLAWKATWRTGAGGMEHSWQVAGVNFDAAFRNGVGGSAQILSGNGDPA